jgi:hypothetical protein
MSHHHAESKAPASMSRSTSAALAKNVMAKACFDESVLTCSNLPTKPEQKACAIDNMQNSVSAACGVTRLAEDVARMDAILHGEIDDSAALINDLHAKVQSLTQ